MRVNITFLAFSVVFFASSVAAAGDQITASLQVESDVIATRGSASVTQADLDVYLERVPEENRAPFLSSPQRVGDILDRLLRARQVFYRAEQEDVWDDPQASAALYQGLIMAGADYYLNRVLRQQVELPDYTAQARELYLTEPELVRPPVHVSFTGFFVAGEPVRGELDAMRSIINVYDLMVEGSDFIELTQEHSETDSVHQASGRVENVSLTALPGEISDVLQYLRPGEISQPFRTEEGWRIVQLHERARPEVNSFEDVAELAEEVARRRHHAAVRERIFRELSSLPVEFEDDAIPALLSRYGASFGNQSDYEAATRYQGSEE